MTNCLIGTAHGKISFAWTAACGARLISAAVKRKQQQCGRAETDEIRQRQGPPFLHSSTDRQSAAGGRQSDALTRDDDACLWPAASLLRLVRMLRLSPAFASRLLAAKVFERKW